MAIAIGGSTIIGVGVILMKLIPLSQFKNCKNKKLNLFAQIDDEDFEKVNKFKWQVSIHKFTNYASRSEIINGRNRTIQLHRYLMDVLDSNILIDHADHNGLNCQKNNLRKCTHSQNSANQRSRKNSSSKYLGVYFFKSRNKWVAQIEVNKRGKNLGYFINETDAALAYNEAAKKYHGEFANLNIVSSTVANSEELNKKLGL